jgi:hypothetical protein
MASSQMKSNVFGVLLNKGFEFFFVLFVSFVPSW